MQINTYLYPSVLVTTTLPVGGATSANQTLQITQETAINTNLGTLNTSVNGLLKPSSTLTAITSITNPVTVNTITGFALESGGNLAAIENHSASVDTKLPSQGQALSAASMPVVLPASQVITLTPPAAITNFALETGGNLAAIKADVDKIPSQGQALSAASMPVVLPASQVITLTPPAAITNFALDTSVQNTQGTKAPGAAASKSNLIGAIYTAAGVSLTDGQQAALQLGNDGSLRVNIVNPQQATGTITSVQKTVGTSAVRATVSGSAPSARKKLFLKS